MFKEGRKRREAKPAFSFGHESKNFHRNLPVDFCLHYIYNNCHIAAYKGSEMTSHILEGKFTTQRIATENIKRTLQFDKNKINNLIEKQAKM